MPGAWPSFDALADQLASRSVQRALWNSVESSALSAAIALVAGSGLALLVGLTNVRAKGAVVFLVMLPMMIPPHVTAIAWIQALGPASPVLRWLDIAPALGSTHPLYSRAGVVALLALYQTPLVLLVVLAALRALPREMVDAARSCGASPWRLLVRILLPMLAPALLAAFFLAFVSGLGNFGIAALLGIPARYTTLPVLIWRRLSSFGPDMLGDVAVLSALFAVIALTAVALQVLLLRRYRSGVVGPPQPPLALALGRWRPFVEAGVWAYVAGVLVLPLASLLATSLVRTYGVPLNADTLTLEHYRAVILGQGVTWRAFVNSAVAAGGAAVVLAVGATVLGYFLARRGRTASQRVANGVAALADVTYAVPGLVLSVAFILAFINPLPLIGVSLYGSLGIIFIAYLAAFFSIAIKPVSAAYVSLDDALDDAARVTGASYSLRMRRIFGPLVAPAAASGAILVFLTAYNEVTVSALLWSTGNETIGTTIFNYEDGGYTTLAAAMSSVTVVVTVMLMAGLHVAGRWLPSGVVPWRS